jgi:hypothetical protein
METAHVAGQKLGTQHAEVLSHWHELDFRMEVTDVGGLVTSSNEAEGHILDELQLLDVGRLTVREPNRCCKVDDRLHQGLISNQEHLLIVAPKGLGNSPKCF